MPRKVKALATSGIRLDGCIASFSVFVCLLSTLLSGFSVVILCPVSCSFRLYLMLVVLRTRSSNARSP